MDRKENIRIELINPDVGTQLQIPYYDGVKAGFVSSASDFTGQSIDLNRELIRHPESTFFARVRGTSMQDFGIDDGDLAVIDKSLEPADGRIAVCYVDGEFTLKRIKIEKKMIWLIPGNDAFPAIRVDGENDFLVWGILIYIIKKY